MLALFAAVALDPCFIALFPAEKARVATPF